MNSTHLFLVSEEGIVYVSDALVEYVPVVTKVLLADQIVTLQ
jgi:hypothetical protein